MSYPGGRYTHAPAVNAIVPSARRGPLGTGEFYATENARRVGEVGLGTNVGIRRFVPMVSFINERVPTLPLGFGAHLQPPGLAYTCHVHLDLILDRIQCLELPAAVELEGARETRGWGK